MRRNGYRGIDWFIHFQYPLSAKSWRLGLCQVWTSQLVPQEGLSGRYVGTHRSAASAPRQHSGSRGSEMKVGKNSWSDVRMSHVNWKVSIDIGPLESQRFLYVFSCSPCVTFRYFTLPQFLSHSLLCRQRLSRSWPHSLGAGRWLGRIAGRWASLFNLLQCTASCFWMFTFEKRPAVLSCLFQQRPATSTCLAMLGRERYSDVSHQLGPTEGPAVLPGSARAATSGTARPAQSKLKPHACRTSSQAQKDQFKSGGWWIVVIFQWIIMCS